MGSTSFAGEIATDNPFVLIHGLFGFEGEIFSKSYWGDIPVFLQEKGARVFIADLSAVQCSAVRAEQLYEQLLTWGHKKYHLIGHSLGGLDARLILEKHPNLVASISTIATPHRGSFIADGVYSGIEAIPIFARLIWKMGDCLGCGLDVLSHYYKDAEQYSRERALQISQACAQALTQIKSSNLRDCCTNALCYVHELNLRSLVVETSSLACEISKNLVRKLCQVYASIRKQDAKEAIKCLTTKDAEQFNLLHPKGISQEGGEHKLFSWGTYKACRNSCWDLTGLFMQLLGWLFFMEENDGMVGCSSMKFGEWLGKLPDAHHLIPTNNGLGSFPPEHIEWFRAMFITLASRIAEKHD